MTLSERLDNEACAREWNKQLRGGKTFWAVSPLNGQHAAVVKFRARKGHLQGQSERTGKWLGVTRESVRRSA